MIEDEYKLVEDDLDELIDKIKSLRASARSEGNEESLWSLYQEVKVAIARHMALKDPYHRRIQLRNFGCPTKIWNSETNTWDDMK